jgi:hypothetical protein
MDARVSSSPALARISGDSFEYLLSVLTLSLRDFMANEKKIGTLASIVVLIVSNNSPIDHWSTNLQTSVWLSTTKLANLSLGFSLTQGIIIMFWKEAGRGSTVYSVEEHCFVIF